VEIKGVIRVITCTVPCAGRMFSEAAGHLGLCRTCGVRWRVNAEATRFLGQLVCMLFVFRACRPTYCIYGRRRWS